MRYGPMRPTYSMNVPPSLFALEASIPDPKDTALKVDPEFDDHGQGQVAPNIS